MLFSISRLQWVLISNDWFLISVGIALIFDSDNFQYLDTRMGPQTVKLNFLSMSQNSFWQQPLPWCLSLIFFYSAVYPDHKNQSRLWLLKVLQSPEAPEKTKTLNNQRFLQFPSFGNTKYPVFILIPWIMNPSGQPFQSFCFSAPKCHPSPHSHSTWELLL